jgi:hypothetical protein
MKESLATDFSAYYPPSSQDDITWFKNALEHQERKFFVAFVVKEPRTVPEILYEPMMRAAVYKRDPSKNRAFVQPCVAAFGLRRVNESLLQWFENGSDLEKAGAVQALYHLGLLGAPDSYWRRPDSRAAFKFIRHRLEIEMGSDERQLFAPLPAMERSEGEGLKSLVNRLRRWRP